LTAVQRVTGRAAAIRPGLVVVAVAVLTAPFIALGWAGAKLWYLVTLIAAAMIEGWVAGTPRGGPPG
jgi:hypothetical protein